MDNSKQFNDQCVCEIEKMATDNSLKEKTLEWILATSRYNYTYHFNWLGLPVIQFPQDIIAMQEIIWSIKPEIIIETGIARGGSLLFYSSMLELNSYCDGHQKAMVIGIDIDIRPHNREVIENHPLFRRITILEGSSIKPEVINTVKKMCHGKKVMVCLDSMHTHDHVLAELEAYAPMVTKGSYCVVFDTLIEDVDAALFIDKPWGPGNNPKTAVWEFMETHPEFEIDKGIQDKLLITVAPDGYLKKIK